MHDALEDVCDRILRGSTIPDSGGTPASVIITIDLDDLLTRTGHGTTSDGQTHSIDQILTMAGQAEIIPTVCTATGAVLNMGRTRRIATLNQTYALYARDRGCSFPGCAHHHNFATRGWTCHMINRLPAWIPPRWIDPHQRPMINQRIRAAHLC